MSTYNISDLKWNRAYRPGTDSRQHLTVEVDSVNCTIQNKRHGICHFAFTDAKFVRGDTHV
jgi:hypothetical protein